MITALQNASIVLVEDNASAAASTIAILKLHDIGNIRSFRNGQSALIFLNETVTSVDLFLLDVYIPGESGLQLIEQIRHMPNACNAKIVALTGGILFSEIRQAKAAGFDALIGKPIKPHEFPGQLARIMAGESLWEWQ